MAGRGGLGRGGGGGGGGGEERDNTLLHKDKHLSTIWLFCISVPDDKHSNTQCIKQEYS